MWTVKLDILTLNNESGKSDIARTWYYWSVDSVIYQYTRVTVNTILLQKVCVKIFYELDIIN